MNFGLESTPEGVLTVALSGDWADLSGSSAKSAEPGAGRASISENIMSEIGARLSSAVPSRIDFDATALTRWDSTVIVLILRIKDLAEAAGISANLNGLPAGLRSLISLSQATPSRAGTQEAKEAPGFFELIGAETMAIMASWAEMHRFLAESLRALGRRFRGKAQYQKSEVSMLMRLAGPQALPIVSIVNLLLGIILAFMGAVQLSAFGAEIFVANLVALGQTRDIAPMMTAIVMAGRTGAAYAAQLGTMQVNEEIDALETFGFSPIDFLVLPRMIALALMMPLLVLYADALGIIGGYLIGVGLLGLGTVEYIEQTRNAIGLGDIALGVVKGSVFGVLVAVTGCMRGMQSGRSASAVGDAATSAVVSGIIAIIVMTAFFAVLTNALGI